MKLILSALTVVLCLCVLPSSAYDYCSYTESGINYTWTCDYTCCYSYLYCCNSLGAVYWYAWVLMVVFILLCVCACAGGGYGYRRYYYVRRVHYPPPTATVVTHTTTAYQQQPGYQPYSAPGNAPPAYNPNAGYQQAPPKY